MSKIGLEFYYMSGLPVPVEGLGKIYQPRLRDFIDLGLDISDFSHPFLIDKQMIFNMNKDLDEVLEKIGRLKFLFMYDSSTQEKRLENGTKSIIENLTDSLKVLYRTENITVIEMINAIIVDNQVIITDDNFDMLAEVVIEMLRIDVKEMRKKIEERRKREEMERLDPRLKAFREAEEAYKRKASKDDDFTLLDIANVVIHSQSVIDYEKVFDLTIYQLKNSYEVAIKKEVFNVNLMHRISPNFQPSEDFKLWEEKAHITKSTLNQNG